MLSYIQSYLLSFVQKVRYKSYKLLPYLLISTFLFLAYFFNLRKDYAWSDDYPAMISPEGSALHSIKDLRPLHGLITTLMFGNFNSVSNLWIIRFSGLVLLIAIANLSYKLIQESISEKRLALCLVIVIYQLPPFLNSVYWAMGTTSMMFALILSSIAYRCHFQKRSLQGYFLLTLSFLIYPLCAWAGISLFLLVRILTNPPIRSTYRILKSAVLLALTSALSALLVALVVLESVGETPNKRTEFLNTYSFSSSTAWLLTRMIPQSFRPFFISSPSEFTAFFQVVILVGFLFIGFALNLGLRKSIEVSLNIILSIAFLLLPGYIIGYNQIEPRFFVGTSILVTGVFLVTLYRLIVFKGDGQMRSLAKLLSSLLFSLLIIGTTLSNSVFFDRHVQSTYQQTESFIGGQLENCLKVNDLNEILILERSIPWESKAYLGMLSQITDLSSSWVPTNATLVFLSGKSGEGFDVRLVAKLPSQMSSDSCIIKLDDFNSKT